MGFPIRHDDVSGGQSSLCPVSGEQTNAKGQLYWERSKLKCSDQFMIENVKSLRAFLKPGNKMKLIKGNHASHYGKLNLMKP